MDRRVVRHGIVAIALACMAGVPFCAAGESELSSQELKAAVDHIKGSAAFGKAAARGSDPRMYLVSASKYVGSPAAGAAQEIVEVLYYKYEGGVTIRAALDARSGEVLELEELKAYPAPLADEEHAEAIRLARERSDAVRRIVAVTRANDLGVYSLSPVVADPQDARYGHRLVLLTFFRKTGHGPSVMVEVDLTQQTVRPFAR
jgi:hypothetical protein